MWPFKRKEPDVEALIKAFAEKAPPDLIAAVSAAGSGPSSLTSQMLSMVVLRLRDADASAVASLLARVFDVATQQAAMVESVMSSYVLLTPAPGRSLHKGGQSLAMALHRDLGRDGKILYSERLCVRGVVAAKETSRFVALFEEFGECIAHLDRLEFGEIKEFVVP